MPADCHPERSEGSGGLQQFTRSFTPFRMTVLSGGRSVICAAISNASAVLEYHSAKVSTKSFLAGLIEARGGDFGAYVIMDPSIASEDQSGVRTPSAVPRVP